MVPPIDDGRELHHDGFLQYVGLVPGIGCRAKSDLERDEPDCRGQAGHEKHDVEVREGAPLKEDLSLRQSEARLAEIKRQRESQWKEWLPRPTFHVSLQNSFRELGDFSTETFSNALYAPLTIPNPWSQTAKAYQYALQEVQATDSLELSRRRQIITLYRLYAEWDRLEETETATHFDSIEERVQSVLRSRESEALTEERRQMLPKDSCPG